MRAIIRRSFQGVLGDLDVETATKDLKLDRREKGTVTASMKARYSA
jgi:hypothetical protein